MASSRKKQDENNMKTLRELGAQSENKFCFDCGQRGPTYVNVTIGSFVCTKCSGMLRGITPPHRVKSISMATFTPEEIDTLRERGNDYCRRTWLGLYEGTLPRQNDEQGVRDFMVEKYEKKRYYLENNMTQHQEPHRPRLHNITKTQVNGFSRPKNGLNRLDATRSRPEVKNSSNNNNLTNFAVDFDKADIFSNSSTNSSSSSCSTPQNDFANFDTNPVFDSTTAKSNKDTTHSPWSVQPNQTQVNGFYPTVNGIQPVVNGLQQNNNSTNVPKTNGIPPSFNGIHPSVPNLTQLNQLQDKYAALKDLDEEMKSQNQSQSDIWASSNGGSTGSLYSSPTPTTGSAYGSPSSQGSLFGSPNQGQLISAFPAQDNNTNGASNPFNTGAWGSNPSAPNGFPKFNGNAPMVNGNPQAFNGFANGSNGTSNGFNGFGGTNNGFNSSFNGMNGQTNQPFFNPFKQEPSVNGFANFGAVFPQNGLAVNGTSDAWGGNPFKVTTNVASANSSNPFL